MADGPDASTDLAGGAAMLIIPIVTEEKLARQKVVNYFDEDGNFCIGNPRDPEQLNARQDWCWREGWDIPEWPGPEVDVLAWQEP